MTRPDGPGDEGVAQQCIACSHDMSQHWASTCWDCTNKKPCRFMTDLLTIAMIDLADFPGE